MIRRWDTMRTIFAEYTPQRYSIDIYTNVGYMLRIDCWEAEKDLKTTPGSDCALTSLAVDEPLEYARLYLEGNLQMWVDAEDSLELYYFLHSIIRIITELCMNVIISSHNVLSFPTSHAYTPSIQAKSTNITVITG